VAQGPRVAAFEAAFAEAVGADHAVAVSSCTAGLHLCLLAAGVAPGDEVVVPSLSFVATANVVRHCGAVPVFADVDPRSYNLDPAAAEAAIGPRTRAVMPAHQVGLPADLHEFQELAERRGVALIEDAACAVGAEYRGRPIGSRGGLACFSLHARKLITTGEGGMITTDDEEVAARLRRLRHQGMSVSDLARHSATDLVFETYDEVAYNYRMTDLQAALGLCQLEVLDDILTARRRLADRYGEALEAIDLVEAPDAPPDRVHNWQSYLVRLSPAAPLSRDELMQVLLEDGISTRRGIQGAHAEPAYAGEGGAPHRIASFGPVPLANTEALAAESLQLPLYPELEDAQQDRVIASLRSRLEP